MSSESDPTWQQQEQPQRSQPETPAKVEWLEQLVIRATQADGDLQRALQSVAAAVAAAEAAKTAAETAKAAAEKAQNDAEAEVEKARSAALAVTNQQMSMGTMKVTMEESKAAAEAAKTCADEAVSAAAVDAAEIKKLRDEVTKIREEAATSRAEAAAANEGAKEAQGASDAAKKSSEKSQEAAAKALAELSKSKEEADEAINAIKNCKETANEVNVALMKNQDAGKALLSQLEANGKGLLTQLQKTLTDARKDKDDTAAELLKAAGAREQAEVEAKRASEAHNLSTTAGLAGAFNKKALDTKGRERFWGLLLVVSLVAAGSIGYSRYGDLRELLASRPDPWVMGAQFLLTLFGVGAPVWLAWMSTRMISRNFALTEDYAYKAALAQAYVGFRQEARGLDPLLEQRLFAAAISQLDANPVRLIDQAHPGSPLQDLLQQPFMGEVLQDASVKQRLLDWFKARFNARLSLPEPAGGNVTPISSATKTADNA